MKKTGSKFVIILLTFFLVPFALFLIFSSIDLYKAVVSNSWPTANGIVISSRVDTTIYTQTVKTPSNNRNGSSSRSVRTKTVTSAIYAAVITYKYQVEGIEYQSSNYTSSREEGELVWVNDLVSKYPANTDVTVYYNPKKPGDAVIAPGIQHGEMVMTIFPLVITLLLSFLLLKRIKARRSQASNTLVTNPTTPTTESTKFDDFFNFNLKHKLEELEAKRIATTSIHNWKTYRRTLLVLLVLVIIDVTLFNKKLIPEYMIFVVPASVFFAMFYPLVVLYKKGSNFLPINEEYKKRIVPELISFVNTNLTYEKEKGILQTEFNRTRLFDNATIFSSEDLITGEINGISYQMADVKAKSIYHGHGHNSGKTSDRSIRIIFEGLYVIATFNKDFGPPVYFRYRDLGQVMAGKISNFLGNQISNQLPSNEAKGISIDTVNSDFNGLFNVKCDNEESAKAIITPAFINAMLNLNGKFTGKVKQFLQSPVNVYIQGNEVHIALFEVEVFELNALTSVVANDYSRRYCDLLTMSIELAETLK
ncbi:MAG TPA: DUF3137 domain-containing protein [Bacteroidales bacterium]|nr:DUF3137 domain-containing protein [Bacteroidales bacterium]